MSQGGGLEAEGELISVREMSIDEVKEYVSTDCVNSPTGFLYAVSWFMLNKLSKYN